MRAKGSLSRRRTVIEDTPAADQATWRDGMIVYIEAYAHREDALTDLGVSEDELEPIEP